MIPTRRPRIHALRLPCSPRSLTRSKETLFAGLLLSGLLTACQTDAWPEREPATVSVSADSLTFYPPREYALPGDVLAVSVHGLKRVYVCARVLNLDATAVDSAGARFVGFDAQVELPGTPQCAISSGLDTVVETSAAAAGQEHYLRLASGRLTDSLFVFSGTGATDSFLHPPGDTLRALGRYTFRDSTAGHPRRVIYTDSLATCEVLQAATFRRLRGGDTLTISLRTLLANPALPAATLPACAGLHGDTVRVVEDRYGFP